MIQKFRETGDLNYIYNNELDRACFAHGAAYSDSKDLAKLTISDTNLNLKFSTFNPKCNGCQRG